VFHNLEPLIITVAHKGHDKINFITAKSTSSRQFQLVHGNINLFTAKSICPWQNHFHRTLKLKKGKFSSKHQQHLHFLASPQGDSNF
jgi:hypothetical protein